MENIFFENTIEDEKIIKEKGVLAEIIKISTHYRDDKKLSITLRLLNGKHVGKEVHDGVSNIAGHQLNWKYHALRNSAGLRYPTHDETLDEIKTLLMNKPVVINLSEFKYTNYRGAPDSCQSINYVTRICEQAYRFGT